MHTPGRRNTRWIPLAAVVATAGCATQPAPLHLQLMELPASVRLTRAPESTSPAKDVRAAYGDIPLAESSRYARIEDLLMARAPGLEVQSRGSGRFALFVRQRASLSDEREPLVVIDGVQYALGGSDAVAALPPRDVKRIEVLRDASAGGLYGARGAAGVVVITTRHGDY